MPQEYVPKDVKATGSTDVNGNEGYSVLFSDGSNAFLLAKKAPQVGVPEYGEIYDAPKKNKPGETYKRFKRMMKEDGQPTFQASAPADSGLTARVATLEKEVAELRRMVQDTSHASIAPQTASESPTDPSVSDYVDISDIDF